MNRLGQRGPTMLGWDGEVYAARASAFGWHAIQVDGHDVEAIHQAYREASAGRPADLHRGPDREGPRRLVPGQRRGVARQGPEPGAGRAGHRGVGRRTLDPGDARRSPDVEISEPQHADLRPPTYHGRRWRPGRPSATRWPPWPPGTDVVVLDGEVSNSTHTDEFQKAAPDRFFEMFIAEQCMAGAAVGMQVAAEGRRSPPRSERSSPGPTTSSGWPR